MKRLTGTGVLALLALGCAAAASAQAMVSDTKPEKTVEAISAGVLASLPAPARAAQPTGGPAAAPAARGRLELWVGLNAVRPRMSAQIATSYVPQLPGQTTTGTAGQTLWLNGRSAPGFEVGANFYSCRSAGVQILFDYDRFEVGGTNDPYSVRFDYTSMQPPDYLPRPFTFQQSIAWPDTSGHAQQVTIALNGVVRWTLGRRAQATASAGLAFFDLRGTGRSLGYTEAFLGGHSVLFVDQYRLAFDLDPAQSLGFDVGGSVDFLLAGRASLVADVRYFTGAHVAPQVTVRDIVNPSEVLRASATDVIQRNLHPPSPSSSPARSRVMIGLKVRL